MKVLDVKSLQSGIDVTKKDIEEKRDQIETLQKAVHSFHTLDDGFKGQGGKAIRSFYRDMHEPFLVHLHQSFIDYGDVLNEMKEAIESFESNENGYVSQTYVEDDVVEGFDKVDSQVTELTDDANSIIESVEDLVSIKAIDASEVHEDVEDGKDRAKDLIAKLHSLDQSQVQALQPISDQINNMKQYLTNLETMFSEGNLSIDTYDSSKVRLNSYYTDIFDSMVPHDFIRSKVEHSATHISSYLDMLYSNVLTSENHDYVNTEQIAKDLANIKHSKMAESNLLTSEEVDLISNSGINISPDDTEDDVMIKEYLMKLEEGEIDGGYSTSDVRTPESDDYGEITIADKKKVVGGPELTGSGFGTRDSEKAFIKGIANFFILDDINTIRSKDESIFNKSLAVVSLIPAGKVLKVAKGKKLFSTAKKKPKHNLTKKQLATKPKHSPSPDRWVQKGGKVEVNDKGTWIYTNKKGQSVSYPNGFPDFSKYIHPKVKPVKIRVNKPKNHQMDYKKANTKASLGKNTDPAVVRLDSPPKGYTWHHHQDGETMILVKQDIHAEFTHQGGASMVQNK